MNGAATEPRAWTGLRLFIVTVIAAIAQVALIYWTSDPKPFHPRTAIERPAVQLASLAPNELIALTDPTIFSRAHAEGFSGPAWLTVRVQPPDSDTNTAPLQWLGLASARLGETLRDSVRVNPSGSLSIAPRPQPALTQSSTVPELAMATVSFVELKDALAARALTNFPSLPSQSNADILLPSEVQVLVDARGNPISVVLLRSSGLKTADQLAVSLARSAQFTPLREARPHGLEEPTKGTVLGRMIFHWHTVPAPTAANGGTNPR